LSRWIGYFTEIDPALKIGDSNQNNIKPNNLISEGYLKQAKQALVTTLKCWQGLIYLGNER